MISKQSQVIRILPHTEEEEVAIVEVVATTRVVEEATEEEVELATSHSTEATYKEQVNLLIKMMETTTTLVLVIPSLTSKTCDFS